MALEDSDISCPMEKVVELELIQLLSGCMSVFSMGFVLQILRVTESVSMR